MDKIKHFLLWFFSFGFLLFIVIGVYGLIEDYPILEDYTEIIAYSSILGSFILYPVLLKFVLKFPVRRILNVFAYVLGGLIGLAFPLGFFLFAEIYAWIIFSLWVCVLFVGIGAGLLVAAYYIANKIKLYKGSLYLLLLFGCEFAFIGIISITAGRFLI